MNGDNDSPLVHVIRLSERAAAQIEAEHQYLETHFGAANADAWEDGLADKIATLATFPERCPVAPENDLFQRIRPGHTLRLFLYRRSRTGPVWRVLFSVTSTDEIDPPTLQVHRILHGSQSPLTDWPLEEML